MIKNVVLGGFAVAAVGMMLMMVRKASRPLELPTAETIVGVPPALESEADIVGEADESQMAMEGVELPEDQVKTKKMLEQVQDMVKKNPADAAALLNLWLTAEQ
jgi:flagellar biosynthesis/type III secretory pathway M-ring protein FliF/YscJ